MPTNVLRRRELGQLMPEGGVVTRPWLIDNGFSRHAIDNLVKSGQLATVTSGVYSRWGVKPTWQGVAYFLQINLGLNLKIGGLSALEMLGLSHYLPLSSRKNIHLYGMERPPAWVHKIGPDVNFEWHSEGKLLGAGRHDVAANASQIDPLEAFTRLQPWKDGKAELQISSPERAILEILADVPQKVSFEHADQLVQGMTSLSPRSLQTLLEKCENIKVRRLFFWLAERHRHPWIDKLQPERIDMGLGKRMLVKGGKLDKKYLITIPELL
jgi:hypothetical protein